MPILKPEGKPAQTCESEPVEVEVPLQWPQRNGQEGSVQADRGPSFSRGNSINFIEKQRVREDKSPELEYVQGSFFFKRARA